MTEQQKYDNLVALLSSGEGLSDDEYRFVREKTWEMHQFGKTEETLKVFDLLKKTT